ncbi:MAG: OmpA family protein [Bacteroidetes bacterium]|nr:OmpA family protein [Bacteroidota bacterium]
MKTIYIKLLTVLFCSIFCSSVVAQTPQNVEFNKKNFSDTDGFKVAEKALKEGQKFLDKQDFPAALEKFLIAQKFNPSNADLNFKIGLCYVYTQDDIQALPYFQTAIQLDPVNTPAIAYYHSGIAFHLTYKFAEAIDMFRKYKLKMLPSVLATEGKRIDRRIYECENAIEFMKDTTRAFVYNMGKNINSPFYDHSPVITADQSMLFFTSMRANSFNSNLINSGEYDENIWYSTRKDGAWAPAKEMPKPLNTKENDATVGLSPDGQQMFIYNDKSGGGDIFISEKRGDTWSTPKSFSAINSPAHELNASFSYDGRTVYFTSNNKKGVTNYGDHDIFKCEMDEKGKWGKWINLGPTINTEYDEVDVFMHPDGRTMYFSSTGHKGMGGYDIFKTELQDDGTWSTPQNLGYPINSPGSERCFVTIGSGRFGYFSGFRDGTLGGYDIYEIRFLGPAKNLQMSTENMLISALTNPIKTASAAQEAVEIKTSRLTIYKGVVRDAETKKFLEATIEVIDNETRRPISTLNSNAATGEFLVPLPSGKNYGVTVKKDGYLFYSANFDIPATAAYQEVVVEIDLLPLRKDATIVLRNVFFETASAKLDPKSNAELDKLIKILKDYPKMVIEISGHTDNVGSRPYNQNLSENRAASVVKYLSETGKIDKNRLQYAGYGFDKPMATNETVDGRALNRRVEFKIISVD